MSDGPIRLRYQLDVKLMAQVMAVAGQRLQAKVPFRKKLWSYATLVALFIGGFVLLPVIEQVFGITLSGLGFLAGIAFALIGFVAMQRSAIRVLASAATDASMRRGDIVLTISEGGLAEQSGIGRIDVVWDAVDEIGALRGATIIRFGAMCFAVPDSALTGDLSPDEFRAQLSAWQSASETFG